MSLHIDFSRRPCVDRRERLLGIGIPILLVVLMTLINAGTFGWYRLKNRDIHERIRSMEQEMDDYGKEMNRAAAVLKNGDSREFLQRYRFLRHVSQRKALQWSALLDRLGEMLPPTVRISVISPSVKGDRLVLSMSGEALTKADQLLLLEALDTSSYFDDAFVEFEQLDSATRNLKFSMTVVYRGTP